MLPAFFAFPFSKFQFYIYKKCKIELMKDRAGKINAMIYPIGNIIYFLTTSIISNGAFVLISEEKETLIKKEITNTNYGFLSIPEDLILMLKSATVCIISSEINYEKKLFFHLYNPE